MEIEKLVKLYRRGIISWVELWLQIAGEGFSMEEARKLTEKEAGTFAYHVESLGGLKEYVGELAKNFDNPSMHFELVLIQELL